MIMNIWITEGRTLEATLGTSGLHREVYAGEGNYKAGEARLWRTTCWQARSLNCVS